MATFDDSTPVAQLCADLVHELGDGWSIDTTYVSAFGCILDGPDRLRLIVHDAGRSSGLYSRDLADLGITGLYPDEASFLVPPRSEHQVGASGVRGAALVARTISERLLPALTVATREVHQALDEAAAQRKVRRARRDHLVTLLGETSTAQDEHPHDNRSAVRVYQGSDATYGDFVMTGDGSTVVIKARRVPYDKAARIAAILGEPPP